MLTQQQKVGVASESIHVEDKSNLRKPLFHIEQTFTMSDIL